MRRKNYIYRFKTKDEMIQEYGVHWRGVGSGFVEDMDSLHGQPIEDKILYNIQSEIEIEKLLENDGYFKIYLSESGDWNVSKEMVVRISIKPNYKPKELVR